MPTRRYAVLDSYRFIAAMGIVAYHFAAHFAPFLGTAPPDLDGLQTFVDLFFVLSGFVIAHAYGSGIDSWTAYLDFLRKRFARIYPLHAATLLVCVLVFGAVALTGFHARDPSLIDMGLLLPNIFLVHAWGVTNHPGLDSPSWSISAETFVYLLYPLLAATAARLKPAATFALAVAIVFAIEAVRTRVGLPSGSLATFDFGMLRALPLFLAGIAAHAVATAWPARPVSWLVPHSLFAVIGIGIWAHAPLYAIDALYPALVILVAVAERGGRPTVLASRAITRLGDAAFAVYMTHTFVQVACVGLVRRAGWTSPLALVGVGVVGSLAIIMVGLASFAWYEVPMRRWLGGGSRPDAERVAKAQRAELLPLHGASAPN